MAEISASDVEQYTSGRLPASDPETARMLSAALSAARNYCGWHVSPVRTDVMTMDGRGGCKLRLRTQKIVDLTSIVSDGVAVDSSVIVLSAEVPGLMVRRSGRWSTQYSGIVVTIDHGYTDVEASDWRQAILAMVDEMSQVKCGSSGGPSDSNLVRKRVDDVEYQWTDADLESAANEAVYSSASTLARYTLSPVYFV